MDVAPTYSITFVVDEANDYSVPVFAVLLYLELPADCSPFQHCLRVLLGRRRSSSENRLAAPDFYPLIILHQDVAHFRDHFSIFGSVLDHFWVSLKSCSRMPLLLQQPCFSPFCFLLTDWLSHYSESISPKTWPRQWPSIDSQEPPVLVALSLSIPSLSIPFQESAISRSSSYASIRLSSSPR